MKALDSSSSGGAVYIAFGVFGAVRVRARVAVRTQQMPPIKHGLNGPCFEICGPPRTPLRPHACLPTLHVSFIIDPLTKTGQCYCMVAGLDALALRPKCTLNEA